VYVIVPPVGSVTEAILPVTQYWENVPLLGIHAPLLGVDGVGSYVKLYFVPSGRLILSTSGILVAPYSTIALPVFVVAPKFVATVYCT
jgi:hypothetical protein